jgi:hypothetical protein
LVVAARRAAALRLEAERLRAAVFACRDRAARDAALWPSRCNARRVARARRGDAAVRLPAALLAAAALRLVVPFALRGGGGNFTPARRAFDNPMAMACFVERAPCLPSRTW